MTQLGVVTESIDVSDKAPLLQTETPEVGAVLFGGGAKSPRYPRRLVMICRGVEMVFTRRKALLAGIGGFMTGCTPHADVEPSIEFTTLPPSGEGSAAKLDIIEGCVKGAKRGQQIVLFARSGVWWVQPFEAMPLTAILPDSTWKSSTHPGSAYAALLVSPGYRPPPRISVLPQKGGPILAVATAQGRILTRPEIKTLDFSGYEWKIRQTPSDPGGSRNMYDSANAWTDDKGFLHLRIAGPPDRWTSGEVSLTHSLGYGSYRFIVRDVSHLEPAAVFSISTWDDTGPSREMDIEIGRWGESSSKNAQYVVQPFYVPANTVRFETQPGTVAYSFRWEPGRVSFQADRGGASDIISKHLFTSGVPSPGNESIHLNHYAFANTRNPLRHGSEVIIEKFEYLP
jgi:hypothetical protein